MKLAALAVFVKVSSGRLTLVLIVALQRAAAGQVESPPPLAVTVFVTVVAAEAVGVTGITKLVLPPAAKPAAIVQVTV